jgi:hypothetical protein
LYGRSRLCGCFGAESADFGQRHDGECREHFFHSRSAAAIFIGELLHDGSEPVPGCGVARTRNQPRRIQGQDGLRAHWYQRTVGNRDDDGIRLVRLDGKTMHHTAWHEAYGRRQKIQTIVLDEVGAVSLRPEGDLCHAGMLVRIDPTKMNVFACHHCLDMHEADVERPVRLAVDKEAGNR